jgi:hypothetical protein
MWKRIEKSWADLKASPPGERFEERYHRHRRAREERNSAMVLFRAVIAAAVALLGVLLLFAPGPGLLLLGAGAVVLATESLAVARLLDRMEIRVRRVLRGLRH